MFVEISVLLFALACQICGQSWLVTTGYYGTCANGVPPQTPCDAYYQCLWADRPSTCSYFAAGRSGWYYCCANSPNGIRYSPRYVQRNDAVASTNHVAQINQEIRINPVMLYTRSDNYDSMRAKNYLQQYNILFQYHDVDVDTQGFAVLAAVQSITGQQTVPFVFICGTYIASVDVLYQYLQSGYFYTLYNRCAYSVG